MKWVGEEEREGEGDIRSNSDTMSVCIKKQFYVLSIVVTMPNIWIRIGFFHFISSFAYLLVGCACGRSSHTHTHIRHFVRMLIDRCMKSDQLYTWAVSSHIDLILDGIFCVWFMRRRFHYNFIRFEKLRIEKKMRNEWEQERRSCVCDNVARSEKKICLFLVLSFPLIKLHTSTTPPRLQSLRIKLRPWLAAYKL